jgi:hypothetical protein
MQAFCADVEVVEHEGGGTMVEDVMLEIAVINVALDVANVEAAA